MRPRFPLLWAAWRGHLLAERHASPVTVTTYRRICWDFNAFLEPKSWWKAGPRDLAAFIARPAPSSRTGVRAANTKVQISSAVRGLYGFAYRQGLTTTDRMAAFVPPKGGQPHPRGFDQAELRVIIEGAAHDPRLHLLCWLGYGAGLRCIEMARLRVEQIDLRHAVMDVWGKGDRRRPVDIVVPGLRAALGHSLAGRPRAGPLVVSERPPYGPLTAHTISAYLSAHIHAQGLDGSAHDLRHSFIWWLLEHAGEQHLKTISLLAGHADTGVTERVYALKYLGRAREVLAQLPDPRQPSNRPATTRP